MTMYRDMTSQEKILDILERLCIGQRIGPEEIMEEYGMCERSMYYYMALLKEYVPLVSGKKIALYFDDVYNLYYAETTSVSRKYDFTLQVELEKDYSSQERVLILLIKLFSGELIDITDYSQIFNISRKTAKRDFNAVENLLTYAPCYSWLETKHRVKKGKWILLKK